MPVKRTDKYKLSQWESSDRVLMEDFNTDNLNLENALAGLESSKARQTDLAALKTEVAAKAASSALTNLQNTVNAKANQSDLTALSQKVDQLSAALNTAQTSIPRLKIGTYMGDGTANRFISVGFTPKAVLVTDLHGATYYYGGTRYIGRGGLAVTDGPANSYVGGVNTLEITTNGFIVTSGTYYSGSLALPVSGNDADQRYNYIAIG